MLKKAKTVFICQNCSYEAPKWLGQCPTCGNWNTFVESIKPSSGASRSSSNTPMGSLASPIALSSVSVNKTVRLSSKISEFDRVLGGGFVPGQVILLSGEPGIGKSTILTQLAKNLADQKVLYICGEESPQQIKLRTERMNYSAENLLVLSETNVEVICAVLENSAKDLGLVIIDSIQTLFSDQLVGIAGSVGQIRYATQKLTETAKKFHVPILLVGHITKEGVLAGPKVLEHVVDTVLYLEGDSNYIYRLLKTTKNRFGPVSEVGVFEMGENGMNEVKNPSEMFLSQRLQSNPGSCVTVVMEGYRPLLFEVQSLAIKTTFGYPKRTVNGFSLNRLNVLLAILEKRGNLNLSNFDIYISIAGGFKITEYACDLAVCLAVASSVKNIALGNNVVAFGECGLSGEIRRVSHLEKRIKEAKNLGFSKVVSPENTTSLFQALKVLDAAK